MTTLAPTMTSTEIYSWIVDMLHEMFEIERDKIVPEANLYTDLDIDSIDAVDIIVKLNQMTGKRIQPDVFRAVRTVQDVVNVITTLLQADEKV